MPMLCLENVPDEVYQRLQQLAVVHQRSPEAEAVSLLEQGLLCDAASHSQATLLEEMRRHSFTPPPGIPDSVEWLREDRQR